MKKSSDERMTRSRSRKEIEELLDMAPDLDVILVNTFRFVLGQGDMSIQECDQQIKSLRENQSINEAKSVQGFMRNLLNTREDLDPLLVKTFQYLLGEENDMQIGHIDHEIKRLRASVKFSQERADRLNAALGNIQASVDASSSDDVNGCESVEHLDVSLMATVVHMSLSEHVQELASIVHDIKDGSYNNEQECLIMDLMRLTCSLGHAAMEVYKIK